VIAVANLGAILL